MQTSIINPIIKAFKIVPIPGFCFKGNQSNKTIILIKIVIRPMEKPMFRYKPWANTLQGDAPDAETINKPSPKPGDMIINVMKGKKLTNMRTQGTDENVVLTPVRKMSIAEQLSMLNTDEALEITPDSCRLRKAILDPHERKKSEKTGAAA